MKPPIIELYDCVANGYDNPAMRYFPFCADEVVYHLRPVPGAKVLDVATGTGNVAFALSQSVGPHGRVFAIDLAEKMLSQLELKATRKGVQNVDIHVMDAQRLDFRANYFDAVSCSFAIFLLPAPEQAIKEWLRVLKPGGRLVFTSFAESAFEPMAGEFRAALQSINIPLETQTLNRFASTEACTAILRQAGAIQVEIHQRQFGYHMSSEQDWWSILVNSGYRYLIDQIPPAQRQDFQLNHLQAIKKYQTDHGIWLDVSCIIASARKPSS